MTMSQKERALRAIFSEHIDEDNPSDDFPKTYYEKAGYAEHCLRKSLEYASPALSRLERIRSLLLIGKEGEISTTPNIILHNEARMALEKVMRIKLNIDDAVDELRFIHEITKEGGKNGV